jgi:hypothetical protein
METGLVSKAEVVPGVFVVETLTVVRLGSCSPSIVNNGDREIKAGLPRVTLLRREIDAAERRSIGMQGNVETECRFRELRKMIRSSYYRFRTEISWQNILRL